MLKEQQQLYYSSGWNKLNNYPLKHGRNDDLYFFNPERGFTINSQGHLLLTEDGGDTWEKKFRKQRTFFRCLTFRDSLVGFLGTLGPDDNALRSIDTISMYETFDGGETWEPTKFNGPYPKGLCGLQTVSDKVIVGCGRVRGPSYFIKSVDGGKTWNSYDYNHLAGSLIAPYFYDEQHGLLIGGTTTDKIKCRSLVLETFDGGNSWDTIYISPQMGEYCWKVAFPTKEKGFISIQHNVKDGQVYVLQTNDGGENWFENEYYKGDDYVQGIGFVNEKLGWMGGSNKWTMETRDGGETWQPTTNVGVGFNKFQFFGDTMGYGVGFHIYKFKLQDQRPNGEVKAFYKDGSPKSSVFYKDGIQEGATTNFYENGRIKSQGILDQNLRAGRWTFYNEDGTVRSKVRYNNGVAKVSKRRLKDFVGKYQIEPGEYRTITYDKGRLYSKHSDTNTTFEIIPISDVEFIFEQNRDFKLEFIEDASGKVTGHIMKTLRTETLAELVQ